MWREQDGAGPLKAIFLILSTPARSKLRPDGDIVRLLRAMVIAREITLVVARIHDIRVIGAHRNITALAAAYIVPIYLCDTGQRRATGQTDARVILLAAVHAVGYLRIGGHVIKFCGGLIILGRPARTAVEGDTRTTVIALYHALRILRVNPQIVIIGMRGGNIKKGTPAVNGLPCQHVENPERVRVLRMSINVHIVPGTMTQAPLFAKA